MAIISKIEWTESTWNPITGCTKVSSGCEHCYAEKLANRLKAMGNVRYQNGFNVTIHKDIFELPLSWKKPRMVFVNSMSDIFHEKVSDSDILALFSVMNKAELHTFQVLTKRGERLTELSSRINWTKNIWMGVTVEDSDSLWRNDLLKQTGAYIKFISAEPLISSIANIDLDGIDWLIVGGESGSNKRPLNEDWVIELKEAAEKTHTAFFFKQWGGLNKKKTGCLLGGKEYKEFPSK